MGTFPVTVDPTKILLTDVSFYQDDPSTPQPIDFNKMKSEGVRGVIIRAGQNSWPDVEFKTSWENAKLAGLPRGSYYYYDNNQKPSVQAKTWCDQFENGDYGELPLWCDFEDRNNGKYFGWKFWYDFMENVKFLIPNARLGIYTGYYYWTEFSPNIITQGSQARYFANYDLWIASYDTPAPRIPKLFTTYKMWQFSDLGDGYKYGVESKELDMNYFNGTEEEWLTYSNQTTPPQPPTQYPQINNLTLTLNNGQIENFVKE